MFSTSDLRSNAEAYKRDAAHKHKWALGATDTVTRIGRHPRPFRPSETQFNARRRLAKGAVAAVQHDAKMSRKKDLLDGASSGHDDSESSVSDHDDVRPPPFESSTAYSFNAARTPIQGTQILNAALAKAVEQFEERETVNLVRSEYNVLDAAGEIIAPGALKKRKPAVPRPEPTAATRPVEEDYDFV